MIHLCNGILLNNKKEWAIDILKNIDNSYRNYVVWKKPSIHAKF